MKKEDKYSKTALSLDNISTDIEKIKSSISEITIDELRASVEEILSALQQLLDTFFTENSMV